MIQFPGTSKLDLFELRQQGKLMSIYFNSTDLSPGKQRNEPFTRVVVVTEPKITWYRLQN